MHIKEILSEHSKWLRDPTTGQKANLREADLRWADLRWADLGEADLRRADLGRANLRGAVFETLEEAIYADILREFRYAS